MLWEVKADLKYTYCKITEKIVAYNYLTIYVLLNVYVQTFLHDNSIKLAG